MRITPRHPGKGVWLERTDLLDTVHGWQRVLPDGTVFVGLTAAQIHGLWLPQLPRDLPVMVSLRRRKGEVVPHHRGVVAIRNATTPTSELRDGLLVETVAETLRTCCRYLGLLDAVVLIDSALHQGLVTLEELQAVARRRRRGVVMLRLALQYVDGRSESAWETMLRLLHVVCGIAVTPQVELHDEHGRFVARVDLRVDATGQVQEYDGGQHREVDVQADDLDRERALANIDQTRRGYLARHVLKTPELVLDPVGRALGRTISAAPWRELVEDSLYRRGGRARLQRTLGRSLAW